MGFDLWGSWIHLPVAMRWFFTLFGTVVAVLFLSFVAWITTRVLHWDGANVWVGRVMIWDLYAIAVVMSYVAFVGSWHLWERLTGRMELGYAARLQAEGRPPPPQRHPTAAPDSDE